MKTRAELLNLFLERDGSAVIRIPIGREYKRSPVGYQTSRVTCIRKWEQ